MFKNNKLSNFAYLVLKDYMMKDFPGNLCRIIDSPLRLKIKKSIEKNINKNKKSVTYMIIIKFQAKHSTKKWYK